MTTKHKLRACLPHGDPDKGAEVDCEIAFSCTAGSPDYWNKTGGHWEQGWDAEIEFIDAALLDANGKHAEWANPRPYSDYSQAWLAELARDWLESDEGRAAALEEVAAELEDARAFIAEIRRES